MKTRLFLLIFLLFSSTVIATAQSHKPMAQNFVASSINGEQLELKGLQGKVVLLTFWSTKCAICVSEIPALNSLSDRYSGRDDVVFVGLGLQNESQLSKFLRKKPFNFKIVPNAFGVILKYADRDDRGRISMGFPSHYLINRKGEIVMRLEGFDRNHKLPQAIESLLVRESEAVD